MRLSVESKEVMKTADRVSQNTSEGVNESLQAKSRARVMAAGREPGGRISARLTALQHEWDIERVLQANASLLALIGTILGLTLHRRFLAIPCLVLFFLLQHPIQGWCPPMPIFRRMGFRTRQEIDREIHALKALRRDFDPTIREHNSEARARLAWEAVTAP